MAPLLSPDIQHKYVWGKLYLWFTRHIKDDIEATFCIGFSYYLKPTYKKIYIYIFYCLTVFNFITKWMSEYNEWDGKMNVFSLSDLCATSAELAGKNKSMLSLQATWFPLCLHSCTVFTWEVWQSCRNNFFFFFQFQLSGFWLNKAVESTTNFASGLGGYLSLYVGWRIDFLPPTTLMKPLPGGSSGNSSCADNFELSYLVTVQTRVNAQICFRCLSLRGSISSCFCFQG